MSVCITNCKVALTKMSLSKYRPRLQVALLCVPGTLSGVCLVSAPAILSWKLCCIVGVTGGGVAAISVRLCLAKIRNALKSSYFSHPPTVIPVGFVFCILHGL